jgi:phosphoribosyl 1,2-cyclic phosphate phosphodiesterase
VKITFLGTGTSQGVPVIACDCPVCKSKDFRDNRLRTSVLVEVEETIILIDSGPDFRQQMLRHKVKRLDAILYTHEHKDHIAGLDDVRAFNFLLQKPIDLFLEYRVLDALKREFSYVFSEYKYPGIPQVNTHILREENFEVNGINIIPIRAFHYKLPVLGFRIGDFTYITDANYIPEEEKEKIIGTQHLVVNALRKQKHISHYTLNEAVKLINEFGPRRGYLTHISHQMGFYEEVCKELPPNIMLAYDGLTISA